MKALIKFTVPLLLILLFTYAAASKLLDIGRFRLQLYLQPFPHWFADLLLYLLPALELALALLLCIPRWRLIALISSACLLAVFTVYISLALLHFWDEVPCSCGGILNRMSWNVHLAFNWAFILAAITAIALHLTDNQAAKPPASP
ncbi:MauE/DoxX family redox-associated membrane protein [Mucilaginibacter ginsenosidivorax]|uniref:Methylamine utilisation protein MauE domain-containing protein n=1 Tax=Mucilaginibacter ginsenosidivorax TaxID=862126 RepID=A0A5B8VSQ0_9SPHI|nr:MauE/DoxX family redox-associated membrane protein [Mucilaginibacter ginsenosidivorax]QEC74674.1 hypothetical protein FSB76_01445 [Mucilaginibacter ginsenosidivorax]